jgi:hypothetical protein
MLNKYNVLLTVRHVTVHQCSDVTVHQCSDVTVHQYSDVTVHQCSETSVMHFSISLLRIKGLYMFRAKQTAFGKLRVCVCVRVCVCQL